MNPTPTAMSCQPVTFSDGSTLNTLSGPELPAQAGQGEEDAIRVREAVDAAVARPGVPVRVAGGSAGRHQRAAFAWPPEPGRAAEAVLYDARGRAAVDALDRLLAAYRAACRPAAPLQQAP